MPHSEEHISMIIIHNGPQQVMLQMRLNNFLSLCKYKLPQEQNNHTENLTAKTLHKNRPSFIGSLYQQLKIKSLPELHSNLQIQCALNHVYFKYKGVLGNVCYHLNPFSTNFINSINFPGPCLFWSFTEISTV